MGRNRQAAPRRRSALREAEHALQLNHQVNAGPVGRRQAERRLGHLHGLQGTQVDHRRQE